jgi:hypothetical protein
MCDRARHRLMGSGSVRLTHYRLMNPPAKFQPGLSVNDFTPLPLNTKLAD